MDLDKINVSLRPRDGWQSIDLGFQMARQWFLPLATLWLCLALPLYAILKLLQLPGFLTLLSWWWFKPLYEAPLSFWCSRAMFSEPVSHRQALSETMRRIPKLLSSYLSIRRLSASRSQDMNVIMLENLTGAARSQRIDVLNRMATRTFALISACLHFEVIMFYGILLLAMALMPTELGMEQTFDFLTGNSESYLATTITEIITVLVGALIAPFYVCAGFALYINRRTQLEAWDIELDFRRTASRARPGQRINSSTLSALLLAMVLFQQTFSIQPVHAGVSSETAKTTIETILSGEDYGSTTTKERLRIKEQTDKDVDDDADMRLFDGLGKWVSGLATTMEVILWGLFLASLTAIAIAVYKHSTALQEFATRMGWRPDPQTASTVFDLDIRPQTLPANIPATAKSLIDQGKKREAMSLLYRGALSRLVHKHGMSIETSETENQCVDRVSREQPEYRSNVFSQLTSLWQQTAYAQTVPADSVLEAICEQWHPAFDLNATNGRGDAHG